MFSPFYPPCRSPHFRVRGFSLLEMMVVLSIFVVMMAVVLANLPSFRDKTTLDLIAQEIAVTIRQAQVYGVGTRTAGPNVFPSFGVYFNPGVLGNRSFILYADADDNQNYDPADACDQNTECIEEFIIHGGVVIDELRGCIAGDCSTDVSVDTDLAINFKRPYPEASFLVDSPETNCAVCSYAKIIIESTRDPSSQREIQIWNTGQISVKTI